MRIAVIADIHGNLPALEAVLTDIVHRDVDRIINLGDCVAGPLWPRDVCELLMSRDDLTIRGNHDRWVSGADPTRMGASDRYAHAQLNQDHRSWLAALPTSAHADHDILACHGTPTSDDHYLLEEVVDGRLVRAKLATIRERLGDAKARVTLCGHSHQQHFVQLPNDPTIMVCARAGSLPERGPRPHLRQLIASVPVYDEAGYLLTSPSADGGEHPMDQFGCSSLTRQRSAAVAAWQSISGPKDAPPAGPV